VAAEPKVFAAGHKGRFRLTPPHECDGFENS
jgi:hypothetical protein